MTTIKHKRRKRSPKVTPAECLQWLKDHVGHVGDGCLTWPFSVDQKGYGRLTYLSRSTIASRLMCTLAHGEPPMPSHHAAHSCGNGHLACVHPGHVLWKTPAENRMDANMHGTGKKPAPRRLTFDQVQDIKASDKTCSELGAEYGVHQDTISLIRRGVTWKEPRSTFTRAQMNQVRDMSAAGVNTAQIARSIGASYTRVWKLLKNQTFSSIEP